MKRLCDAGVAVLAVWCLGGTQPAGYAADTFVPYGPGDVPKSVTELWKGYDARREPLNVKVVKEWRADGVTTRYVTFTVGTFKGAESRIAAYYSFPDAGGKHPAFVWSHGGGQQGDCAMMGSLA